MRPNTYLLFFIPLLASLSCARETEGEESSPVSLSPRIAGVSLTRSGINEANEIDAIGFYAVGKDKDDATTYYGTWPAGIYGKYVRTTQSGHTTFIPDNSASTDQALWLVPEKDATIFSCHPVPANGANDIVDAGKLKEDGTPADGTVTISVPVPVIPVVPASTIDLSPVLPADGNTDFTTPENDYMYGVAYDENKAEADRFTDSQPVANGNRTDGTVNQSGPSVAIGMKHAFVQLKLILKKGDSYPGTPIVSEVKYARSMQTLTANTKMKLTDGTFLGTTAANAYTYNLVSGSKGKEVETGNDLIITSYALPCAKAASTISLTVDNKDMSIAYGDDPEWVAGKIYTYAVTIHGTGLSFSGVSVVSWNAPDDGSNDSSGTL